VRCGCFSAARSKSVTQIIRKKQVAHIKSEVKILRKISHPFLVNLYDHNSALESCVMCTLCADKAFTKIPNGCTSCWNTCVGVSSSLTCGMRSGKSSYGIAIMHMP